MGESNEKLTELLAQVEELSPGKKKLNELLAKRYKVDSPIFRMADDDFVQRPLDRFSSGELGLDIALGGGWVRGRIHKVEGRWSSGKSHIVASAIAEETARHKNDVLLVDYEGTWTPRWLLAKGADINRVFGIRPTTAEMALDVIEAAVESGEYSTIVLDSVAAMSPDDEMEGSHEDWQRGLLARLVSKFCRKLESRINAHHMGNTGSIPTVFLVNQVRKVIDSHIPQEFTPGGSQQDNTATTIVSLWRNGDIWEGENDATPYDQRNFVGFWSKATVRKNKVSPPMKSTLFGVLNEDYLGTYRYNFFHADTLMRLGIRAGLIEQAGAWYEIKGYPKMNGKIAVREAIAHDDGIKEVLVVGIKRHLPHVPIQYSEFPLRPIAIDDSSVLDALPVAKGETSGMEVTQTTKQKKKEKT